MDKKSFFRCSDITQTEELKTLIWHFFLTEFFEELKRTFSEHNPLQNPALLQENSYHTKSTSILIFGAPGFPVLETFWFYSSDPEYFLWEEPRIRRCEGWISVLAFFLSLPWKFWLLLRFNKRKGAKNNFGFLIPQNSSASQKIVEMLLYSLALLSRCLYK